MSETDIYLEVLKNIGFKVDDEKVGWGDSKQNIIYLSNYKDNTISKITFNRETEKVIYLTISKNIYQGNLIKESVQIFNSKNKFEESYKEIFRNVKIQSIISF